MPNQQSQSPVEVTREALDGVLTTLRGFPHDYRPDSTIPPELAGVTISRLPNSPAAAAKLQQMRKTWPRQFYGLFVGVSSLIPQILQMYDWRPDALRRPGNVIAAAMHDPDLMQLMSAIGQVSKEMDGADVQDAPAEKNGIMAGFRSLPETLMRHLTAEVVARGTPFGPILQVLLGPEAPVVLSEPSDKGVGNMQPHELSRVGWPGLSQIFRQLEIERELTAAAAPNVDAANVAKCMVCLCWAIAAMASFVQPAIFLSEAEPHLSSTRGEQMTTSTGRSTHTLLSYQPASMIAVVEICLAALAERDITACDLMWMAAGAAIAETVQAGHAAPIAPRGTRYETFLSHRGLDSKSKLAHAVRQYSVGRPVFLDCLTMPHGVINRAFVFGSVARSKSVLVVDTPNFSSSAWCRKELWLAQILNRQGRLRLVRSGLDDALVALGQASSPPGESGGPAPADEFGYPIARRILQDLDYELRAPNRASAGKKGLDVSLLTPVENLIGRDDVSASERGEIILDVLRAVASTPTSVEAHDLLSSALQLTLAAISPQAQARSKVETRNGVDRLNAFVSRISWADIQTDVVFQANAPRYLALVASAVLIDLTAYGIDPAAIQVVERVTKGVAFLQDQTLVLDVRVQGPMRDLHLRLLLAAIRNNIGALAILQTAADPVHELVIDGQLLSVLPCVTLYPGMEDLFPVGRDICVVEGDSSRFGD